jgi:hypothetical protein
MRPLAIFRGGCSGEGKAAFQFGNSLCLGVPVRDGKLEPTNKISSAFLRPVEHTFLPFFVR